MIEPTATCFSTCCLPYQISMNPASPKRDSSIQFGQILRLQCFADSGFANHNQKSYSADCLLVCVNVCFADHISPTSAFRISSPWFSYHRILVRLIHLRLMRYSFANIADATGQGLHKVIFLRFQLGRANVLRRCFAKHVSPIFDYLIMFRLIELRLYVALKSVMHRRMQFRLTTAPISVILFISFFPNYFYFFPKSYFSKTFYGISICRLFRQISCLRIMLQSVKWRTCSNVGLIMLWAKRGFDESHSTNVIRSWL